MNGRNPVASCEINYQVTVGKNELICAGIQSVQGTQTRDRGLNFGRSTHVFLRALNAYLRNNLLCSLNIASKDLIIPAFVRTEHDYYTPNSGFDVFQKLNHLTAVVPFATGESGDVAARSGQVIREPSSDCISSHNENDRHFLSLLGQSLR